MHLRSWIFLALLTCGIFYAQAQRTVGIAYYDADRLYDTLPALFYDDSDFTPAGRLHWTAARYNRKIRNIASVLDSLGGDLIALAGVENEQVVRDLAAACREDYCYVHRTLNGFDGLDIALFYHADRFDPVWSQEGRGWLFIAGSLLLPGCTPSVRNVGLVLCSNARYAAEALEDCREQNPDLPLIAAGCVTSAQAARLGLRDAHARAEQTGRGTIRYRNGWRMRERILTDTAFAAPRGGDVYARRWLFAPHEGRLLPTYDRTAYRGGYGRSLPVYTYLIFD